MGPSRRFRVDRVEVEHVQDRRATWNWRGSSVTGMESVYAVVDRNYDRLNRWLFLVQQLKKRGLIIVRPNQATGKSSWGGIDRSSVVFPRTTRPGYRGLSYCKIGLADPSGGQTKFVMRRAERDALPPWMRSLRTRMRLKQTVAATRGTDGRHQVLWVRPDDHARMIRFFFAMKVWVLDQGYQIVDSD